MYNISDATSIIMSVVYFVSQLEWTPLMSAIVYGRYEGVAELIMSNVDLQDYVSSFSMLLASGSKPSTTGSIFL